MNTSETTPNEGNPTRKRAKGAKAAPAADVEAPATEAEATEVAEVVLPAVDMAEVVTIVEEPVAATVTDEAVFTLRPYARRTHRDV